MLKLKKQRAYFIPLLPVRFGGKGVRAVCLPINQMFFIMILLLNGPILCLAQPYPNMFTNDGIAVKVDANVTVTIQGSFRNETNGANHGTVDNEGKITVTEDWSNNATGAGNVVFITNGGHTVLLGTADQTVGGTASTHFDTLTAENTGDKILDIDSIEVNHRLNLDAVIFLSGNKLVIDNNNAAALNRISDYIVSDSTSSNPGELQWNITTATGTFLYPFGTEIYGTDYMPFTFDVTAGGVGANSNVSIYVYGTEVTANPNNRVLPAVVTDLDNAGTENDVYVVDRFWLIQPQNYTTEPTADITFTYIDEEWSLARNTITEANLQAQRWDQPSSRWIRPPVGTVNVGANTVTVSGVTLFSPWVLVDSTSPLPIELLYFDVYLIEKKVLAKWETVTEINNDYFTVERSQDAVKYQAIGTIPGNGNTSVPQFYSLVDEEPYTGVSYYRLKQTDYDGKYAYSKIIAVGLEELEITKIYSNIIGEGRKFKYIVSSTIEGIIEVVLIDITGRILTNDEKRIEKGINRFELDAAYLSAGMYMLRIKTPFNKYHSGKAMIVR